MRYLERYDSFIKQTISRNNKNLDSGLLLVEKMILKDFSTSFWDLALNSSVFTIEEKIFIEKELMNDKIDPLNEGWLSDTLSDTWTKAKEIGGDILSKVKNKISIIKDNIKNICKGIADFIKELFRSLGKKTINKANELTDKIKPDFESKVNNIVSNYKPEDLKSEFKQLTATYKHIKDVLSTDALSTNIEASDDKLLNNLNNEVLDLESDLKKESKYHDILNAFYLKESGNSLDYNIGDVVRYKLDNGSESEKTILRIDGDDFYFRDKDGNEFKKNINDILGKSKSVLNKTWDGFSKWFLDMEKSTPPVKGKAVWWIKLLLKIISMLISPIVKALEVAAKYAASNVLKCASSVSKYLKGPGVFEFLVMGGILAGIPALLTEISLVGHKMPEEWAHIFEIVGLFIADISGMNILLTVFGSFCSLMTLSQLITEFKHLFSEEHH